jgi:hypothetical protein
MLIFIFQSSADRAVSGFTYQLEGSNLPRELGPWEPFGMTELQGGEFLAGVGRSDPVIAEIQAYGFYIADRTSPAHSPRPWPAGSRSGAVAAGLP